MGISPIFAGVSDALGPVWPHPRNLQQTHPDCARRARVTSLTQRKEKDLAFLRPIGINDLRAGGEPDLAMARNVGERAIERPDAVRYTDQEWMQSNGHHPAVAFAFVVQH